MTTPSTAATNLNPYTLSWGLLRNDRQIIPLLLILLVIPAVIEIAAPSSASSIVIWSLLLFERFIQLTVSSVIVTRWRQRFAGTSTPHNSFFSIWGKILLLGYLLWAILTLPLVGLGTTQEPFILFLLTVASIGGMVLALRYIFYASITGLIGGRLGGIITETRKLTKQFPFSSLAALIGPFSLTMFANALLAAPDPRGESDFWGFLGNASQSIFWLLSTYTVLAFALTLIDSQRWREAGLDPYRDDRLQTLQLQGRGGFSHLLTPRSAIKTLLLSAVIVLGNFAREMTLPPSATITVKRVEIEDRVVHLELRLIDHEHHFQGFHPGRFTLAGKAGYPVAQGLTQASLEPDKKEIMLLVPNSPSEITLYLSFTTDQNKQDLQALEDLWLWYQLNAVLHITPEMFKESSIQELPEQAPAVTVPNTLPMA